MIRPGSLAVAMVIHVSEPCNPILVCIREGLPSRGSTVCNCKGACQGELLGVCRLCMGYWILHMDQGEPNK
jgi:hypothetical protein